ncbi:MAG: urease accessory protein UreE [Pseudomonadota bacterium]
MSTTAATDIPVFDELSPAPRASVADTARHRVALPFADRQRSRLRIELSGGGAAGIKLPRGTLLRDGQWLRSTTATSWLEVTAAPEPVSMLRSTDPEQLARAAYHLGNRHVWVQIGPGWLRYLADPVLDQMLLGLGFGVEHADAPFEPEAGAYSAEHGHLHAH